MALETYLCLLTQDFVTDRALQGMLRAATHSAAMALLLLKLELLNELHAACSHINHTASHNARGG